MNESSNQVGKWTRRFAGVLGIIFGIVLPTVALLMEIGTGMCAEMGMDPIPTAFHVALVASVPIVNFALVICCRREVGGGRAVTHLLAGFAAAVSCGYALLFLPLAAMGLLFCSLLFWYFGFGLIGLLPAAPIFGFVTALALHVALRHQAKAQGVMRVRGYGWGWIAGLCVGAILLLHPAALNYGVRQALSDEAAVSARGVRLLRTMASEKEMSRVVTAARRGFRSGGFPLGWSVDWVPAIPALTEASAKCLYYRVTGEDPSCLDSWSGTRRRALSWDSLVGGEKVGGVLAGLSLKDSAYETKIDDKTAIGYAEWTLVFANALEHRDQEARLRVDLPHGAVVSRATLWIGGEEREAAFGTKGQVRQAYEAVVRRNRDPLLVTSCGPDQIQVQCFPVPRKGEMKIRLGVTMPLEVAADGKSLHLPSPVINSRNFTFPADLVGLPESRTVSLEAPPAAVAAYADKDAESLKDAVLLQRLVRQTPNPPVKIAVVFDTSAPMKDVALTRLAPAFKHVPANTEIEFWAANDLAPAHPFLISYAGDQSPCRGIGGMGSEALHCVGGRDNVKPLMSALASLAQTNAPSALFWIHGPQPVAFSGAEAFAAKFAGAPQIRLFLCPVLPGPCELTEALRPSPRIVSCPELATSADPAAALGARFASLSHPCWKATYEKVAQDAVPPDAVPADRHLGRLWAAQEVIKTYRVGDPKTLVRAQQVALPWQIVTPVTGAVVLETAQQFKDSNLTPASASSVPTVPEPENVFVLALAALVFVCVLWVRRRRRMNVR